MGARTVGRSYALQNAAEAFGHGDEVTTLGAALLDGDFGSGVRTA
ncbi:hypothetical protein ACLMAL_23335 [Nocardia sp. CWNU-33]